MSGVEDSALFHPEARALVVRDLVVRGRARMAAMPDDALRALLEDTLYHERKRLERADPKEHEAELDRLDRLARALVRDVREAWIEVALEVVAAWAEEVHGRFDPRVYKFATRALPRALTGLLSAKPPRLRDWDLSPDRRLKVTGDLALVRTLAREATLILAPTHVSNLDSPLIGLALHQAGLPPFVYGAGLNLFSNPVMGWFMSRLGAYTVDRTKRAALYKDALKDYSIRCLTTHHHSLFFPGGTRSRSGHVEGRPKKGLLGTGLAAWQEMLAAGRPDPEVYVIPLTLSNQLVLEAATLIDDHLAEVGKQRYIITDDEFAQPRVVAGFLRRVLDLDAGVIAHFGAPLDVLGNPVSADAAERAAQAVRRRRYVCDAAGKVEADPQRDHLYTDRLAGALVEAWPKGVYVMATNLAAWVGWRSLELASGTTDAFRLVRVPPEARRIPRDAFLARLAVALRTVAEGARAGRWFSELPPSPEAVLEAALDRFGRYHKTRALRADGDHLVVDDPKLCLYYRNRLTFVPFEVNS